MKKIIYKGTIEGSSQTFHSLLEQLVIASPEPFSKGPRANCPQQRQGKIMQVQRILPNVRHLIRALLVNAFHDLRS